MRKIVSITICLLLLAMPAYAIVVGFSGPPAGGGGETYTIDDDFSTDTSSDYTTITGDGVSVESGKAYHGSGSDWGDQDWSYHSTSLGSADQVIYADLTSDNTNYTGFVFRTDGTTGYLVKLDQGTLQAYLYSFDGSTTTYIDQSGEFAETFNAGDVHECKASISGTSIKFYIDWNDDGDFADSGELEIDVTDSTYSAGNYCGLYFRNNGTRQPIDNFKANSQ